MVIHLDTPFSSDHYEQTKIRIESQKRSSEINETIKQIYKKYGDDAIFYITETKSFEDKKKEVLDIITNRSKL